jgi:hypothetical protein
VRHARNVGVGGRVGDDGSGKVTARVQISFLCTVDVSGPVSGREGTQQCGRVHGVVA